MDGESSIDTLYLTNKEVVRGRIIGETSTDVTVEKENTVAVINRGAIYNIEYSKDSYARKSAPPLQPPEPSADTRAMLQLLRTPEGSRVQTLVRTLPLLLANLRETR